MKNDLPSLGSECWVTAVAEIYATPTPTAPNCTFDAFDAKCAETRGDSDGAYTATE